jgi:hypothetical protein
MKATHHSLEYLVAEMKYPRFEQYDEQTPGVMDGK